MKILEIPHSTANYLCPANGLCDIYEWKTGMRIPDELIFYSRTGFMLISQKIADPPKMIFPSAMNIGNHLLGFWSNRMGYRLIASEGKTFKNTILEIKELVDINIPVVLFGLDMYHLAYQSKFYKKIHATGHVVLMIGYDEDSVFVLDNSKPEIQSVSYADLEMAWQEGYLNISKKNAYFGIEFLKAERDASSIIQNAYKEIAYNFLNPKVGLFGIKGMEKLIKEFPKWKEQYDSETMKSIYTHYVRFAGSVLPELPAELDKNQSELINPHRGTRDKLALSLTKYKEQFGNARWEPASAHFAKSGEIIEEIANGFVADILANCFENTDKYIDLFCKLKESERKACMELIQ